MKFVFKRFVISRINKLLTNYQLKVDAFKTTISMWIIRLETILNSFKSIISKLDDNKLTQEELDEIQSEIEGVIKSW